MTRRVRDRSAGVAVVVADDEPPAVGEHLAEASVPPEHRPADTHDEEDRRVGGVAERLRAEPHTVCFNHPLDHVPSSSKTPPVCGLAGLQLLSPGNVKDNHPRGKPKSMRRYQVVWCVDRWVGLATEASS